MRHLLSLATAVGLTLCLMTGGIAATTKPAATKASTKKATGAPKCPACGMTLSTKKTKANPRAVKIAGKTYYCCAACKMEANAKGAAGKGTTKKSTPKKGA